MTDSTFGVLLSADAIVPDHDLAIARVHRELGVQELGERHIVRSLAHRATWSFARVHPDRALAPTNLEFLQAREPEQSGPAGPLDPDYAYIPEIEAAQGSRAAKLHSTPIGVGDLDAVIARLRRTGGRYRLNEPSELLPFPRLWVGYSDDRPGEYTPETDGGLWLELVPTSAHRIPAEPPILPERQGDGRLIRILARTILVEDLDRTLTALDRHFGVVPEQLTTEPNGLRRAVLPFTNPRSAKLEVLSPQPDATGFEADLFHRWGPGPCSIRFAVDGLDALRRRHADLGLDMAEIGPLDGTTGGRLLRPLDPALSNAYEFVEWDGC